MLISTVITADEGATLYKCKARARTHTLTSQSDSMPNEKWDKESVCVCVCASVWVCVCVHLTVCDLCEGCDWVCVCVCVCARARTHLWGWMKQQSLLYDRKCLFSCIYNPLITISPTSLFSANFNGNRVKNHLKPWTDSWSRTFFQPQTFNFQICLWGLAEGVGWSWFSIK